MFILSSDKKSRNSDNYLYCLVSENILKKKNIDIDKVGFKDLFLNLKEYGLPKYETVTRIRRKLQQSFPELSGCESVSIQRLLNQESFNEFTR